MKLRILTFAALLALASSAQAQQPASDTTLTHYLRRSFAAVARNLVAAVAMMPEQDFGFRPAGVAEEVRTFGQIVGHIAEVNAFVCETGTGTRSASPPARTTDKAGLVTLVEATNAHCTTYLATLTDAALTETILTGPASRQLQSVRGNAVVFAIAHSNEHYGNLVTYLRAKGLKPPATAAQVAPVALVTP